MIQLTNQKTFTEDRKALFSMIRTWIYSHVHHPIQGFEHKKNENGTFYTKEQQLQATRSQLINITNYFLSRGKSYQEIISVLHLFRR